METVGQRIAAARAELGYTQARLAEALHRTFQQVSAWERGEGVPRAKILHDLARVLGVYVEWLKTGNGPRNGATIAEFYEAQGFKRVEDDFDRAREREIRFLDSPKVDTQILTQALGLVLQELQNRKAKLPPSKIAAAVVEIYELVTSQGKNEVVVDNVTPFVRLLLAR